MRIFYLSVLSGRVGQDIWELLGLSLFFEKPPQLEELCRPTVQSLMRCNRTDGMPRGEFNIYFASSRRGYVRAEEAVGIALLVVILAALLILGCWYFKKRSGYKIIRSPRSGSTGFSGGQYSEAGPSADNKMALTDFGSFRSVVPNAPPAYEKLSSGQLPPPYSP